ncbi:MAG: ABC transporter ATP-binding protein [Bacteroidales bacterium]|jgi:subfamily B ATP-binding cassette protein MsbA|nr:ABC transporter ATP-binding protein [Bacteroidales bacterium]MBR5831802.1 ABC transporter ATP-binding protein [Bacteroidales bacterium]
MKDIFRIFKYLRFFPKEITLNILFNICFVFFSLFSFAMIVPFIELLFGVSNPVSSEPEFGFNQAALTDWVTWQLYQLKLTHGTWQCLFFVALGYIACSFLSNCSRYLGMYFLSPIRNGMIERIRNDFYHHITILPVSFFSAQRKGDILSRLSNDLADIEWSVFNCLQMLVKDPINIIVFAFVLIFISPKMVLFAIVVLPISLFIISKVGQSLKRNSTKGQDKLGYLFSILEEAVFGVKAIKSFNMEDEMSKRFEKENQEYTKRMIKVSKRKELGSPLIELLATMILAVIVVFGGSLVINGELRPAVLIFFVIVFSRIIPPAQAVISAYYNLQKGSAAAHRIFEVLDEKEGITERENAIQKNEFEHSIEYRNVSFAYQSDNKEYVLKNINLTIEKGKTIAVVGPSGAGKTTLVDLLPRFYDCTSGEILIDGIAIKDMNINSLRELSGIVSQESILFNDSILHNIAFGKRNINKEKIIEAAKIANADEFINQLPNGYYTTIGDRGLSLSGGQRQRISIARAILKNPPILILDEATSALDTESEYYVQEALERVMQNRTSIIIAHRLSTIQHADEIIVMDKGEIIERGTHQNLIKAGGLYKKLIDLQSFS